MNPTERGFFAQNCWLKALIFVIAVAGGCFASMRHLVYQAICFMLYFFFDVRIFSRLGFALRKLLPFFTGYWVFGTILRIEFMDMLSFSLRVFFLVLISVYVFGTFEIEQLMQDSISIRRFRVVQKLFYYALAIWLFIQNYFQLYAQSAIKESKSVSVIMNKVILAFNENYQDSPRIDTAVKTALDSIYQPRQLITYPNLIGIAFMAILSIVYAL